MLNGWLRIHRQVALGVRLASLFPNQLDFSMESKTPKVWFSGAHAPNRNMQGALSLPNRGPKFQNKFLEGLRGNIRNQVEKTNAQWMASDPSSSCIRSSTGLLQARRAQQHCANIFAANEIRSFLEEFCEEYPELSKAYSARCQSYQRHILPCARIIQYCQRRIKLKSSVTCESPF